jgi:hypothetical protein
MSYDLSADYLEEVRRERELGGAETQCIQANRDRPKAAPGGTLKEVYFIEPYHSKLCRLQIPLDAS